MTYEEAYKILTEHTRNYVGLKDAEALEVAIGAVKKQIPKKVAIEKRSKDLSVLVCPECSKPSLVGMPHCRFRGHALDWSDTK